MHAALCCHLSVGISAFRSCMCVSCADATLEACRRLLQGYTDAFLRPQSDTGKPALDRVLCAFSDIKRGCVVSMHGHRQAASQLRSQSMAAFACLSWRAACLLSAMRTNSADYAACSGGNMHIFTNSRPSLQHGCLGHQPHSVIIFVAMLGRSCLLRLTNAHRSVG